MQTPANLRQERINLLRRQEDRKRKLPDFLNSLSAIAKRSISESDVVSVEQTDNIWADIRRNEKLQQANLSISFSYRDKDKLTSIFEALRSYLSGQRHYFTTGKFQETCFLFIDTAFCLDYYEELIELDGDTFYIYDKDLTNGAWVDSNEEHWRDKEEYLWTY